MSPVRRSALLWTLLLAPAAPRAAAQQLEVPLVTGVAGRLGARARALPRSIQVFVVPVPALFRAGESVTYTVTPTGGATIIPPLQGVAEAAAGVRTVLVATSVPAAALAGERTIAEVQFMQGNLRLPVPLYLEVAQIQGATLRLPQQLFGARPGERIVIHYVLTNEGNGPDTLDVAAVVPPDWRSTETPRRYVLRSGEAVSGDATVLVPPVSVSGVYRVTLTASSRGLPVATADAVLQLLESPGARALGPTLVAGVATVLGDSGRTSPVVGFELQGPLTEGVQAFGRLVQAVDPGTTDPRGLSRVGYFAGAPFLTLAAPQWQATGGATGRSFSDVTGVSAYGHGASFNYTGDRWSVSGLAAEPATIAAGGARGHLLGVRMGEQVWRPGAEVHATLTDLEDPQLAPRQLQAIGFGAVSPPFSGVTVSGEIAARHYESGSGMGWLTEIKRQTRADFGQLRLVHAPGGSMAFAHARDELSAVASRGFGSRLSVGAGYWTSDDASPTFSRLHTLGWSLAPRYDLDGHTSLAVEARSNSFEASSAAGLLGNGETVVRVGVTAQHGTAFFSGAATFGSASQTAGIPGGPTIVTAAGRQSFSAGGGVATDRGTLELNGSLEHNGAGIGFLTDAYVLGLRATRITLTNSARGPVLSAQVQRYGWFGDRPPVTVARLGLTAPLPGNLALTVDVEHNPFLSGLAGAARWIPVVKVERAVHLSLGALQPMAKGEVFEDRNANGVRDQGEPAIAGAVVRRGTETIVTDRSGRFRFYDKIAAPVRLDETSLPFGTIPNTGAPAERQPLKAIEIGVIPTLDVDVQLVRAADSSGRTTQADLAGVPVQAVDTAGNAWSVRSDNAGRAHFSALPPGRYRLDIDVTGLREPVRLRERPAGFTVEPGQPVPLITVPVYPRPLRLFEPGGRGSRGAGASGGSTP